jgi:hypothetical protein
MAKSIGREGMATGARILTDIVAGEDADEALKKGGREGAKNLLKKASAALEQEGKGRKRACCRKNIDGIKRRKMAGGKRKVKPRRLGRVIYKPVDAIGHFVQKEPKGRRFDSLGIY